MANHIPSGDAHLQDDEHNWFPERTMPQGTQENGVDFQHEERDANVRSVVNWLAALGAGTLVVIVVLYVAFQLLLRRDPPVTALPSPLFARQQVPPAPRLIPNPFESVPGEVILGPVEYHVEYLERENRILADYGLLDPVTGLHVLPEGVTAEVIRELNEGRPVMPGIEPLAERFPSDASGGREVENRLR